MSVKSFSSKSIIKNLFNANMIAKKIDIGITNIDSLGISSKEKNV